MGMEGRTTNITTKEFQILKKKKETQSRINAVNTGTFPRIHQNEAAQDYVFQNVKDFMSGKLANSLIKSRTSSYLTCNKNYSAGSVWESQWGKYDIDVTQCMKLKREQSRFYKSAMKTNGAPKMPPIVLAPTRNNYSQRQKHTGKMRDGTSEDEYAYMPSIQQKIAIKPKHNFKLADVTGMDLMNSREVARITGIKRESSIVLGNINRNFNSRKANVKIHLPKLKQSQNTKQTCKYLPQMHKGPTQPEIEPSVKNTKNVQQIQKKPEQPETNLTISTIQSEPSYVDKVILGRVGKDRSAGAFIIEGVRPKEKSPKGYRSKKEEKSGDLQTVKIKSVGSSGTFTTKREKSQPILREYTSIIVHDDCFNGDRVSETDNNGNKPRTVRFNIKTEVREYEVDTGTYDDFVDNDISS
ncbi:uncharacterized protein LOC117114093 [Anneissia japonica]|uniref:uncharacterized protein LOC117114093 n=1 Tax=Anneissia japonica TaxID=1529436 RepID=UPI0014257D87|nr:uncharacterized protein LOC117114093 [Anneissia japonica]